MPSAVDHVNASEPASMYTLNKKMENLLRPRKIRNQFLQEKENVRNEDINKIPHRYSSPGLKRSSSVGKKGAAVAERSSSRGKRSPSPVPSKCVVPSLMAARDENRKVCKEPAIVVPSRYRQPSPTMRKQVVSSGSKRLSPSPGRRLSGGLKVSCHGPDSSGKKTISTVARTAKSGRKSWVDMSHVMRNSEQVQNTHTNMGHNSEAGLHGQIKEHVYKCNLRDNFSLGDETELTSTGCAGLEKQTTSPRLDLFRCISPALSTLEQEAQKRKSLAFRAATEALEETVIIESIQQCLSQFSDILSAADVGNPVPTLDEFFSLYSDAEKHIMASDSVNSERLNSARLWVGAALDANLDIKSLSGGDRHSLKPSSLPGFEHQKRLHGLTEVEALGVKFLWEMQTWLIRFVEESLHTGFGLFEADASLNGPDRVSTATILIHLKRVTDWLDHDSMLKEDPCFLEDRKEHLKRKIYEFVIHHLAI